MRALARIASVLLVGLVAVLATAQQGGEGEGEGEGEDEPSVCSPGCIDEQTEGLCSGSGQLVPFSCPTGQRCLRDICEPDADQAGAGGCTCQDSPGDKALGGAAVALGFLVVRRRRERL
jgi:hypothetical protein